MNLGQRPSWMWADAYALLAAHHGRSTWEPPADVMVAGDEIRIVVALPGAEAENVVIALANGELQIEARVAPPERGADCRVMRLEIPHGALRRRIALPPGRYRLTERRLARGCLHLRLQEVTR